MSRDPNHLWEGISSILSNIAFGGAGNAVYEFLIRPAIKSILPLYADDRNLQRAVAVAFKEATKRLLKQVRQEDAQRILKQLNDDSSRLFPTESSGFPNTILEVMLAGDESSLQQSLWDLIERPYFVSEAPDLRSEMKRKLPLALISAFGDVLKDERYQQAWIDFQRALLQETHRLLEVRMGELTHEQQRDFARTLERLNAIARDTDLLKQMALTTAETLASIQQVEEHLKTQTKGTETLAELLKQAADLHQARFDRLERELRRRSLSEQYAGSEVANHVEKLLQEYAVKPFVGREEELMQLNDFFNENRSGRLTIIGKAGFGKTALLAAWLIARRNAGHFTAYHFFSSRDGETTSIVRAFRNLLRQIYVYYELANEPLPSDKDSLRNTLYGVVQDHGSRSDEPLVIVVDGLDEAEDIFSPPFPDPLPEGVFVITSARAEEGEKAKPEYLLDWTSGTIYLNLARLSRMAIADYLRHSGNGTLAAFAEDENFIMQIDERTEGFPLYLQYLAEELSQTVSAGQDVRKVLERTPQGFKEYVSQQIKLLDKLSLELRLPEQIWPFFALLAVAKGALRREEIKATALIGMRDRELRLLPQIWQVTRWLLIAEEKGEGSTFYTFMHPLLAEAFAEALGDEAKEARERLLAFCASWRVHRSRYALQHYVDHLREMQRYEELFTIARDEAFWQAQVEVFPDNLDLPLWTVRTALQVAAQVDDAGAMVEFSLKHLHRLRETRQESPLNALRAGNVQRSWALADLFEGERCVLWYLLLAWELKDAGRWEEARSTLKHLQRRELPRLSDWQADRAAQMLAHMLEVDQTAFTHLYQGLLEDKARRTLCSYLVGRGHLDVALGIAQEIREESTKVEALEIVGMAQMGAGRQAEARSSALAAYRTAQGISNELLRGFALRDAAEALAYVGELDTASAIVQGIARPRALAALIKARVQAAIVETRVQEGEFAAAHEIAKGIVNMPDVRAMALINIALTQARVGESNAAVETLSLALDSGPELDDSEWDVVLQKTAEVLAWAGEFAEALNTADKIRSELGRVEALAAVAVAQVQLREEEAARATFARCLEVVRSISLVTVLSRPVAIAARRAFADACERVGESTAGRLAIATVIESVPPEEGVEEKDEKMAAIGVARAQTGEFVDALEAIKEGYRSEEVLVAIAVSQAWRGESAAAMSTLDGIKEKWGQIRAQQKVAKVQAQAGNFTAATSTASSIKEGWLQVEALATVALLQARAGVQIAARATIHTALEAAYGIGDGWLRAKGLAAVAVAQVQVGERVAARGTFTAVKEAINTIEDAKLHIRAMTNILAIAQAEAGERIAAQATFATALAALQRLQDEKDIWQGLLEVAEVQAQVGEQEEAHATLVLAQKFLQEMKQTSITDPLWLPMDLSMSQAKIGEIAAAFNTVAQLTSESWRQHLLEFFALALAKRGEGERAVQAAQALLTERNKCLPRIAEVFLEVGDLTNFKQMLVPCAYYPSATYRMCRLLVQAYPEQVAMMVAALSESDRVELVQEEQREQEILRADKLLYAAWEESFRQAATETFEIDPKLPLTLVLTALLEAAETDDVKAMAAFLLLHARRVTELRYQSPLDILRTENLQQAWEVMDLLDDESSVLWHLLLVWELKDANRIEDALRTLERMQARKWPLLSDWQGACAADLLTYTVEVGEDAITALHSKLLDDNGRYGLCRLLATRSHFAVALAVVQGIESKDMQVMALVNIAVLQAQAGAREEMDKTFALALETMQEATWEGTEQRLAVLATVAEAQTQVGDFAAALATINDIEEPSVRDQVLLELVTAQAKAREFAEALKATQGIEQEAEQIRALGAIAAAQAQVGELAAAQKIAKEIGPDWGQAETLQGIALAQAQAGEIAAALEMAHEIAQDELRTGALIKIAAVQGQSEDPKGAQAILATALENARGVEEKVEQAMLLADIAAVQGQSEDPEGAQATLATALEVVQGVEEKTERAMLMAIVGALQAQNGSREGAQATLATALEVVQGIEQRWGDEYLEVLSIIAGVQAQVGEDAAALETLQKIPYEHVRIEKMLAIVTARAQARQFDSALKIAQAIEEKQKRALALVVIAETQVSVGETSAARATLATILKRVKNTEDEELLQARTFSTVVAAQAQTGSLPAAIETMRGITDSWWRARARVNIAVTLARAGEFAAAMRATHDAEYDWVKDETLVAVVGTQARRGDFRSALRKVQEIRSSVDRDEALAAIAAAQAQAGQVAAAFETLQGIKRATEHQVVALTTIAVAQAEAGEVSAALATAQRIDGNGDRAVALASFAAALARGGQTEEAQAIFADALRTAQKIEAAQYQSAGLAAIAEAQAQAGQREEAAATFTTALEIARGIDRESAREEALAVIAVMQVRAGFSNRAMQTAKGITSYRYKYFPRIARAVLDAGDRAYFGALFVSGLYNLDTAYRMCGLLAVAYPEHATAISLIIRQGNKWQPDGVPDEDQQSGESRGFRRKEFVYESFSERLIGSLD